jgi:hypothetical protein
VTSGLTDNFEKILVRAMTQGLMPPECECLVYPGKLTVLEGEVHCGATKAIPVTLCSVHSDKTPRKSYVLVEAWSEEL